MCLRRSDEPIEWHLDASEEINKHTAYFGGVLRAMEQDLGLGGLTVYLTWDIGHLPSYGDDVVAVVLGDEWARRPTYVDRVRAVFKCYGSRPFLGVRSVREAPLVGALTALQFLQMCAARVPMAVRRVGDRSLKRRSSVYAIPLGYANQVALPMRPIAERRFDIAFAGSVVHVERPAWSPKRWVRTPKSLSREAMVRALRDLDQRHPEWSVGMTLTSGYSAIRTADPVAYSELLMDTKVALSPRGTSFETFRTFEAMRAGCVVVTEALPPRWFYDGAPTIQIGTWSDLEEVVAPLLGDPERLGRLHRASIDWWESRCSEEAVGSFLADTLNASRSS